MNDTPGPVHNRDLDAIPEAKNLPRVQHLECCCCGNDTRGRQWHNRDTGYGLCDDCADDFERTGAVGPQSMHDYYGIRGVHYKLEQP